MSTAQPTLSTQRYRTSESYGEKALRKAKENPLVPLGTLVQNCLDYLFCNAILRVGCLITTATIIAASVKLRQGNSKSFQLWLRARVVAQGLTIVALVGGTYALGQRNLEEDKQRREEEAKKMLEEQAVKERLEFEERLKQAEEAHEAQTSLWARLRSKRGEKPSKGVPSTPPTPPQPVPSTPVPVPSERSGEQTWWELLTWSKKPPTAPAPSIPGNSSDTQKKSGEVSKA